MHCQHCIDKDSLEKELISFDWLTIVSHFCKAFENHITSDTLLLTESCSVERVQHTDAVNAIFSIVCTRNVHVTLAYVTDFARSFGRLRQQIVCLNKVLVVLGDQGVVLTVWARDLNLSFKENLLSVLLILFDELGFALLGNCLSSDIVELIFGSQYSVDWLSSFEC